MPRTVRTGRIRPVDRDADDGVEILGADTVIHDDHAVAVREINQRGLSEKVKCSYRNMLNKMMDFWRTEYPDYYAVGVRVLSEEELADPDMFWWKNTRDLVYTGLNVKMVTAFQAVGKTKANGKTAGFDTIRKYNDAILWGAEQVNARLPREYYSVMDKFLQSFRKETAVARQQGNLDEHECDPISWSLFKLILQWSLESQNVMLWVFSLLQWHCMARSVNIGVLCLHNFRRREDAIVCRYDKNKMDQTGERVNDKHIYDNPFDGRLSIFCAIGVWCSLQTGRLSSSEELFKSGNTKEESAASKYCTQLAQLLSKFKDTVECFMRSAHAGTHSFRKGSATKASSGTTCPPPVFSIASRGEWSLGKILDVYWHFAAPGDTFLGRILAGFEPNKSEFATPPPHWKVEEPMSNEYIKEGMEVMFGPILDTWKDNDQVNPTPFLTACLASVVHHSDWLQQWTVDYPGHPFSQIPLLLRPDLLQNLKALVTLELGGDVNAVSGIPPHIECAQLMHKCVDLCQQTNQDVQDLMKDVKQAVADAIEQNAVSNGQVSAATLERILKEHEEKQNTHLNTKFESLVQALKEGGFVSEQPTEQEQEDDPQAFAPGRVETLHYEKEGQEPQELKCHLFHHSGGEWHVPENFEFPKDVKIENGWKLWLLGMPGHQIKDSEGKLLDAPIRPFRFLELKYLPKKVGDRYKLHWSRIFKMMEEAVDPDLTPSTEHLKETFALGMTHLSSTRLTYVFDKDANRKPMNWSVSTWCKHAARSFIEKHGTNQDKEHLPPLNFRNNARKQPAKRNRPLMDDRRRKVPRRNPIGGTQEND